VSRRVHTLVVAGTQGLDSALFDLIWAVNADEFCEVSPGHLLCNSALLSKTYGNQESDYSTDPAAVHAAANDWRCTVELIEMKPLRWNERHGDVEYPDVSFGGVFGWSRPPLDEPIH
jgi:hypothetical protein